MLKPKKTPCNFVAEDVFLLEILLRDGGVQAKIC